MIFIDTLCFVSADLSDVLERAFSSKVDKIIVTGGCLSDCRQALELVKTDGNLFPRFRQVHMHSECTTMLAF